MVQQDHGAAVHLIAAAWEQGATNANVHVFMRPVGRLQM
jgi:hypothetical protein